MDGTEPIRIMQDHDPSVLFAQRQPKPRVGVLGMRQLHSHNFDHVETELVRVLLKLAPDHLSIFPDEFGWVAFQWARRERVDCNLVFPAPGMRAPLPPMLGEKVSGTFEQVGNSQLEDEGVNWWFVSNQVSTESYWAARRAVVEEADEVLVVCHDGRGKGAPNMVRWNRLHQIVRINPDGHMTKSFPPTGKKEKQKQEENNAEDVRSGHGDVSGGVLRGQQTTGAGNGDPPPHPRAASEPAQDG